MSDLIRAVQASWTPMPGRSLDPKVIKAQDTYSFLQNQIESQQRQSQNNVNRTIRSQRSQPSVGQGVKTPFGFGPVPIIPLAPR
jgi:hypothetical protein